MILYYISSFLSDEVTSYFNRSGDFWIGISRDTSRKDKIHWMFEGGGGSAPGEHEPNNYWDKHYGEPDVVRN